MTELIIIAALTKDRVIGLGGELPWYIPEDLKRFKSLTKGHTVIIGRKTFESVGVLPNRKNIVISKSLKVGKHREFTADRVNVYWVEEDLEECLNNCINNADEKVFIIGGAHIYEQTLLLVDTLELTIVDGEYKGDAYFPEYKHLIDKTFKLVKEIPQLGYTFKTYTRI